MGRGRSDMADFAMVMVESLGQDWMVGWLDGLTMALDRLVAKLPFSCSQGRTGNGSTSQIDTPLMK